MEQRTIDLDHHTTARPCSSAIERMNLYFETPDLFDASRESLSRPIFDLVGASSEDTFSFTSSGAEAIGQVLNSVFLSVARKEGKTQFITSFIEDASLLETLKRLEGLGCFVKIAPVDGLGRIDVAKLKELITPRTALISVSMAQGLTGVIQPIEEIASLAKEKGIPLHIEASYAVGKIALFFASLEADYLTFSGEFFHSVSSSGAVFAKKGKNLLPFLFGRSLDTPSLAAFSAAAAFASLSLDTMGLEAARLRDLLETEVQEKIPGSHVLFKDSLRLPNTAAISFPRVHADALDYMLRRKGVHTNRGGVHCQHLSSLLSASGLAGDTALSFSLSRMTIESEVLDMVFILKEAVLELQRLSEDLF